jgi:hypothetical protein
VGSRAVYGAEDVTRGNDGKFYPKPEVSGDILERALRFQTFPLWTASMLMKREVLLDCLPLAGMGEDDDLDIELGDTDLKIELAQRTKVDYVDECLVFYRQGENELWTGKRKFRKILQNIRHQEELYDRYPEVREDLLAEWYERQGMNWLEDRPWSVRAIYCFMKATYHDRNSKIPKGLEMMASLFGRPGVVTARRAHNMVK